MVEHGRRHIRMAHQIVRGADQFVAIEAADLDEYVVAIGDLSFQVGCRDQSLLIWKGVFTLGYWLLRIDCHAWQGICKVVRLTFYIFLSLRLTYGSAAAPCS